MSIAIHRLTFGLFFALGLTSAFAQTTTTEVLGTVTANQVSTGLGFNLDSNEDWQWAAAAAAGATHARIDCTWSLVEQQTAPPLNQPANPQYVQSSDCVKGLASAKKYGIHPTVVASYGAPFHQILTVTVPKGAPIGSTSVDIEFVSGVGGDTLANIAFPYDYFHAPASVASGTYGKLTTHGSYQGTFITGVKLKDATHATLTFASATIDTMPADDTEYQINEILYPSAATTSPTDPSVIAYGNYVSFLANDMAARGVTGDIEIWNEPPWLADPWDDRGYLYDQNLWPGAQKPGPTSWIDVNWGFIADLQSRTFPAGITATWNGTSGSGTSSALSPSMLAQSGVALKQPSTVVTSESFHPYGYTPEQDNWTTSCLEAAATAKSYPADNPYHCLLSSENTSNAINAAFLDAKAKLINPAYGIGHSVTETGIGPLKPGYRLGQARFIIRQFLAYEADGVTPVEFYKLYDASALYDPNFSFVEEAGNTSSYVANPAFTTLSGFMGDINLISNAPVVPYTEADLASVISYSGSYTLTSAHMVGSRQGARANSEIFAVWQRTTLPCGPTLTNCGDQEDWLEQPSPAPGPVTVQIPVGMSVTSVINLTTRIPVLYTTSDNSISFGVADDPVAILLDPRSAAEKSKNTIPTTMSLVATPGSGFGMPVALTAILTPSTGSAAPSNGETVSFYSNQTLLGNGVLAAGVATLNNVTSIPVGVNTLVAQYAGDSKLTASTAFTSVSVTPATPSLAFNPVATQMYGVAPFMVTASSPSRGQVQYSVVRGPARIAAYSSLGATISVTGTGTVLLQANQLAQANYTAAVAQLTFNVTDAASLAFNPIATQTYGAAPFAVSATSPSSAAIRYSVVSGPATISGSTLTITGAGTVVLQAAQASKSVQTSFVVNAASPALTFSSVSNQTYGNGPVTLSATSTSPATITYSVVSGPATVAGNKLTLTGSGTVVVQASQGAKGNYTSASAQVSFSVSGQQTPTLTLSPIANQTFGSAAVRLSAASNSPGAISYSVISGPATIAGNVVTPTAAGSVVVGASQVASGNYTAASTQVSFSVSGLTPTLTFSPVANQTYGRGSVMVSATSNSPAPITYTVVSGPATIVGNVLTLNGSGTVVVGASQAASGGYTAANAQVNFSVSAQTPALTLSPVANQTYGSGSVRLAATSNSPAAITYAVVSGPATIAGNVVAINSVGTVVVSATQQALGSFTGATVLASFSVQPATPTLTFAALPSVPQSDSPISILATSPSPGKISYSVVSGPASIAGNTLTLSGTGVVVVAAQQAASGGYAAATAQTSFTVTSAPKTTILSIAPVSSQYYGVNPISLSAVSNSPGTITYSVLSGPARIAGNQLSLTGPGTVVVGATQSAYGLYPAANAQMSFAVNAGSLVLVQVGAQTMAAAPIILHAVSASTGNIAYYLISGPARLSGFTVTVTGPGTVVVGASQVASGKYPASSTQTSFEVSAK